MQVVTCVTAAIPVATPATVTTVPDATVSEAVTAATAAAEGEDRRVTAAAEAGVTEDRRESVTHTESARRSRTSGRNCETRAEDCYR